MEIGKKTIAAAAGLFFLGGFSVYLLMANTSAPEQPATTHTVMQHVSEGANIQGQAHQPPPASEPSAQTEELTHAAFLAQAEARREERLINKEENDRLEKLKAMKERSVECKFWKQQQKTDATAAKIEDKITQYCTVQNNSSSGDNTSTAPTNTLSQAIQN
jgi:hypothetical protein